MVVVPGRRRRIMFVEDVKIQRVASKDIPSYLRTLAAARARAADWLNHGGIVLRPESTKRRFWSSAIAQSSRASVVAKRLCGAKP
jgi:hypothetical protein